MEVYEIFVLVLMLAFIGLLFSGFPIAWLLAGVAFWFALIGIYSNQVLDVDTFMLDRWNDFSIVVDRIWALMQNWVLVALPMFIFMGIMLEKSGVAEKLMSSFTRLFGSVHGGLGVAVCVIGILLAASTGIVGASIVLLATLAMPLMLRYGYANDLAAGVVGAAGTLGILIPPSIMLVIMADQLSMSVGDLFMGAVIPGLIMGVFYMTYVLVFAHVRKGVAPPPPDAPKITWSVVRDALIAMWAPGFLILAVLGSIFMGIATATEASGMGAFGAIVLAAVNRRLNWKVVREVCHDTTITTAFIAGIFIGATAFALVMRSLGGDELVASTLKGLPFGKEGIVIVILLFAFVLGFFLDWLEITLIFLPLVAPVVKSLGLEPIWFTVLFAVCLQTSFLTPPVGFTLFYLKGAVPPGVTTQQIYRGIIPFVILQLIAVYLVFTFPQLATWLPEQMYAVRS